MRMIFLISKLIASLSRPERPGSVVVYRDNSSKGVTLIRNSGPLGLVPTTRRRHSVTETDQLTGARDEAARR